MKILLRNQATKLFYAGGNEWKPEAAEAVPFPSSLRAWNLVANRTEEQRLELVYVFGDGAGTFSCPIEPTNVRRQLPQGVAVKRPRSIFSVFDQPCRIQLPKFRRFSTLSNHDPKTGSRNIARNRADP
jgi:hypothetical protein